MIDLNIPQVKYRKLMADGDKFLLFDTCQTYGRQLSNN